MIHYYKTKMVHEIVSCSSFEEVKFTVNAIFLLLKVEDIENTDMIIFIDNALAELRSLPRTKLPYFQNANIISAELLLNQHRLQFCKVMT